MTFTLTPAQGQVVTILTGLIGFTGVKRQPELPDGTIVLHLLPADHVSNGAPFYVTVAPDGRLAIRDP